MDKTQLLDNRDYTHLDLAVELMARGEIIAFGWNGIFVFLGEADHEMAAWRIAVAKRQSLTKPLALVCAPEYLEEFVDLEAPAFRYYPFEPMQRLQSELHSLGVILPARTGLPSYMTHKDTILNVWMEYPPHHPIRYLQDQLRQRGARALIGSSANQHGEPTYTDPLQVLRVFRNVVPAILDYDVCVVPLQRRQSSTLIDSTGEFPRLVRLGSVPVEELNVHLEGVGLPQLLSEELVPQLL